MLRHRQLEFDDPFNPYIKSARKRFVQAAEDVAYACKLAERDGIPDPGSDEIRFHMSSLATERQERLYPMVSFRLAAGTPCALLAVPYADDENVIRGEWLNVIRLDTGINHGEIGGNLSRERLTISQEEASILKMSEPDGTPKGLRGAFHISRAKMRIVTLEKDIRLLERATLELQSGPTEPT